MYVYTMKEYRSIIPNASVQCNAVPHNCCSAVWGLPILLGNKTIRVTKQPFKSCIGPKVTETADLPKLNVTL